LEWTAVVTALSTAAIALLIAVPAVASVFVFAELKRAIAAMHRLVETLNRDAGPALQTARQAIDDAGTMVTSLRGEVEQIAGTSKEIRLRVVRAADAAEERLQDVGTLLDILHDEVEDTVLDVAAALRTTRRGVSVFGAMKRAFRRRRQ
jgi:hypothetical protein